MSVQRVITIVATVFSVLTMVGCTTVSGQATTRETTLKITITATEDGEIRETVVGVIDGKETPLDPMKYGIPVDPSNPIKGLLQRYQGKQVKGGKTELTVFIGASPGCLCRCVGGVCMCIPPGCN